MFICYDITTNIFDNLSYRDLKYIILINKEFYNTKKSKYYKIRLLQNLKPIKCHFNEKRCCKISAENVLKNKNKYIGKRFQFIIKYNKNLNISFCKNKHYILWEFILFDIIDNIMEIQNKKICFNIHNRCNCNNSIIESNNVSENYFFVKFNNFYPHSLRLLL
tara:strand:- start:5686 stop:6174 length:489 start_codon:yes stop_codon:yes gene_type:complete